MQYTICNNFVEQNISKLSEQDGDVKGTFKNGFYLTHCETSRSLIAALMTTCVISSLAV